MDKDELGKHLGISEFRLMDAPSCLFATFTRGKTCVTSSCYLSWKSKALSKWGLLLKTEFSLRGHAFFHKV